MPRRPRSTRSSSNASASRPARSGISISCARPATCKKQTYVTLFIGWPGGTWMPPTERALQFFVDNLPPDTIWNVSVMNPEKQWSILSLAVALGGHVRVGYEDNPYIAAGRVRQEQRRAGREDGRHRPEPQPRGGDAGRGEEDFGA